MIINICISLSSISLDIYIIITGGQKGLNNIINQNGNRDCFLVINIYVEKSLLLPGVSLSSMMQYD
jgi:hypothetical protein